MKTKTIGYSRQGDYLLPDLTVPDEPEIRLGKYGSLRRKYLEEEHYGIFISLLTQGKLNRHLKETQEEAQEMMERLMEGMKKEQGVTEELKEKSQMEWLGQIKTFGFSRKSKLQKNPNFYS